MSGISDWFSSVWDKVTGVSDTSVQADTGMSVPQPTPPAQNTGPNAAYPLGQPGQAMQLPGFITAPFSWVMNAGTRLGVSGALISNPSSKDFLSPGGAWRDSTTVSPGQAALALPIAQSPIQQLITGNAGKSPYGGVALDIHGGFDPTSPQVRKQAFESGGVGEVGSAVADTAYQYFLNPAVVAGYGLKPVIAIGRGAVPAIGDAGTKALAKENAAIEQLKPLVAEHPEPGGVSAPSAFGNGMLDLWNNRGVSGYLANHPLFRGPGPTAVNPMPVINAMRNAQDFDEFATIYLAARGDPLAIQTLKASKAAVFDQLRQAQVDAADAVVAEAAIPKMNPDGTITHEWMSSDAQREYRAGIVKDLTSRDDWLARAIGVQEGDAGVFRSMQFKTFSPLRPVNDYRSARAVQKATAFREDNPGYWVHQRFQPLGAGSAAVKTINWMGSQIPKGWLNTSGAGAIGSDLEIAATLRAAKADAASTTKWTNAYAAASTPAERQVVAHNMDGDLTHQVFQSYLPEGYTKQEYANAVENANEFMRQIRHARSNVLDEYARNGGYLWDVGSNTAVKIPMLESQGAQLVPMTDFALLHQALKYNELGSIGQHMVGLRMGADTIMSGFMQFWKPSVLLRLGAWPRNLGESWLASWVFLGRFPQNPVTGAAHIVDNSARRFWEATASGRDIILGRESPAAQMKAMQAKIGEQQGTLYADEATYGRLVAEDRAEGSAAYYSQVRSLGKPVSHGDVQIGIVSPTRPLLRNSAQRARYVELNEAANTRLLTDAEQAELRTLHAKAFRTHLRAAQREGQDVVVPRGNTMTPIDNVNDIADTELLPRQQIPGRFPPPADVSLMPKFTNVRAAATQAGTPLEAVFNAERRADMAALHDKIAAQQELIDATRDDTQTLADLHRPTPIKVQGAKTLSTPGLEAAGLQAQGANEGMAAQIMGRNFSAASKNDLMLHAYDTRGFMAREYMRRMHPTGGTLQYDPPGWQGNPGNPGYYEHSAHFANVNVRNSPAVLRLFSGESPQEVAAWLGTNEGQSALRQMAFDPKTAEGILEHMKNLDHNLQALYPSEALQARIVAGDVTAEDIFAHLGHRKDLIPVMDDELIRKIPLQGGPKNWLATVVDKAMAAIWTMPEDRLARWPLYRTVYENNVQGQLRQYENHLLGMPQDQGNAFIRDLIEPTAREAAMATVNRVIYSAARRTNPAEALRFVSPFYQVTANRFAYYGGQFLENPQNMARLFVGWNAIRTSKDSDGNKVLTVTLPGNVAKAFGIEDTPRLTITETSLNLIQNSDPWYSPGAGPLVAVPIGEFMRHHVGKTPAWLNHLVGSTGFSLGMFPNNYYGEDALSLVLPTTLRRVRAEHTQQWLNTYTQIMAVETMKYRNKDRPDMPTTDEITGRANGLWWFRVAAAIAAPSQPTLSNDVLGPLVDVYRGMQKKYGSDADAMFLAKYPQYYDYMYSVSANHTGVQASDQAAGRAQDNSGLIESLPDPKMAGLITNLPNDQGNFNSDAYTWEYGRPIGPGSSVTFRGPQTAQDSLNARITSRGWLEYVAAAKIRDAQLKALGVKSINDTAATAVKMIFDAAVAKIIAGTTVPDGTRNADGSYNKINPWWQDYKQQNDALYATRADTLRRIIDHPGYYKANINQQPWLMSAAVYLQRRATIRGILDQRKLTGGSADITANSNADLSLLWDSWTKQLSDSDPQWKTVATRFFTHDDFTEVPS